MVCSILHVFENSLSTIVRPLNLKCNNVQIMVFKNTNIHFLTYFSEATITVIITRGTDLWWRKAKLALGHIRGAEKYFILQFIYFFKYIKAFNSALLFLLFLLFYYFLDLLDPILSLLFLKNALLNYPHHSVKVCLKK